VGGQRQDEHDAVDTTVAGIADARWGVRPEPASERFEVPGWWYEEPAPLPCPTCAGELHALRKRYEGPNRKQDDKPSFLVAVVCPACPATFTLRDLGQRSYAALMGREAPTKPRSRPSDAQAASARRPASISPPASTSPRRFVDCDVAPGGVQVRTIPADQGPGFLAELLGEPAARVIAGNLGPPPQPATVVERRLLHWCKITDPDAPVPAPPAGTDVRVVLPLAPEFAGLCARLHAAGVPCRQVRYWWEAETISTVGPRGDLVPLRVTAELPAIRRQSAPALGWPAAAARDAFELLWDVHAEPQDTGWAPVDAAHLVPEQWVRYLPYATLNPAQAHAAPTVRGSGQHVVVPAPTGAGTTVMGMLAALKAIETRMGRIAGERWGPRLIDLDILTYGSEMIAEADLAVPHPRLHERAFALVPLADIDGRYSQAAEVLRRERRETVALMPDALTQRVRMLAQCLVQNDLTELRISDEREDAIELRRASRGPRSGDAHRNGTTAEQPQPPAHLERIKADLVGVFHMAKPAPGSGENLPGDRDLGFVDALGIRTPVHVRGGGKIAATRVRDGQPVEYGQVLFEIERV